MTRAVIELAHDISKVMPVLCKTIPGCAYEQTGHTMGFRLGDHSVIIEGRRMIIFNADSEEKAKAVIEWIQDKYNGDKIL
jgi:ArsR family metal-binding transcriptional regulator